MKELYQGQETKIDLVAHLTQRDFKTIQADRCLKFILPHKNGGRLLEIGSAAGYFLAQARKAGFDVQGLDLTHQFCRFSRDVLNLDVFEGTLAQAPFRQGEFDVIYMRNVLSHLADPRHEFETLFKLLKPGGILVLETGNVAELSASTAGELELPDHLYHFSEATIRQLFEQTGFRWLKTNRFVLLASLGIVGWIRQLAVKFTGSTGSQDTRRPSSAQGLPTRLPQSRTTKRMAAHLAQFLRYDLGAVLPKRGHRCTLVMVAQRRAA